ncbi:MAG: sulfotransferase family 2 domain-containing protein [Candidatus Promineifilaceae bacterium]
MLDPRVYFQFDEQRLIYIATPKTASTSILLTIGVARGLTDVQPREIRGRFAAHIKRGSLQQVNANYFKFSFVRNPYSRLVSCYENKFVEVREYGRDRFLYAHPPFEMSVGDTFEQFIRRIAEIPDELADRHFKSQTAFLYWKGLCLVDFIGRFETLTTDWSALAKRTYLPQQLCNLPREFPRRKMPANYQDYYTPELAALVFQRYRADFERFGYAKDV